MERRLYEKLEYNPIKILKKRHDDFQNFIVHLFFLIWVFDWKIINEKIPPSFIKLVSYYRFF